MTTLRVVVDSVLDPATRGIARYTEELTRALIETAPRQCEVEGIVSASPESEYQEIQRRLPGLAALYKTALSRRELTSAWQYGFTTSTGGGMIHATSMLAPLRRHDRLHDSRHQTVVTIHDAIPWTSPQTVSGMPLSWYRGMAKRAQKYADAVVVPSHAAAEALSEDTNFGDRVRVIGGAVASTLRLPVDAAERKLAMALPAQYVLTYASLNPRKGLAELLAAMGNVDTQLVVVGDPSWGDSAVDAAIEEARISADKVRVLGHLSDPDLAVALAGADVFVHPTLEEGFGLPILEAFRFGVPVVTTDAPALAEIASDAALGVEREGDGLPERLSHAINTVLGDSELSQRLSISGSDREKAFSWRDSAERVWELHAEL